MSAMCKGAWLLGSACGKCERCISTALEAAIKMQAELRKERSALRSEYRGFGVKVGGKLQPVSFDEQYDADNYAMRVWKSGLIIEVVRVRVVEEPT